MKANFGFVNDFTSDFNIDEELKLKSGGIALNSGVHSLVNLRNIISHLPKFAIHFEDFDPTQEYVIGDIVNYGDELYQCFLDYVPLEDEEEEPIIIVGGEPDEEEDEEPIEIDITLNFFKTNSESIRLKQFINSLVDKVTNELNLSYNLIENQYIYDKPDFAYTPDADLFGIAIEPKGTDYITISINEILVNTTDDQPINLYVYNYRHQLIDTIEIFPNNFETINYKITNKKVHYFVIEKTEVLRGHQTIYPLRYDSFVIYPVAFSDGKFRQGYGDTGMGINISTCLDSSMFISNNINNFTSFVKATFEYLCFELFLNNSKLAINSDKRMIDDKMLMAELKQKDTDTVLSRYLSEKQKALGVIKKSFDRHLYNSNDLEIIVSSI
jgi:hypothetical protein